MKLYKLLVLIFVLFFANQSFAYQTVAMEFNGNWYKARYMSNDSDAIVQYLKQGQTFFKTLINLKKGQRKRK